MATDYDVVETSISKLAADMAAGRVTSQALVRAYLQRIEQVDWAGPTLRSVIAFSPRALDDARAMDAERAAGKVRGALHGVPILVKDNIETADGLPTTAGSLALKDNITCRDAPVVARLKAAGGVVVGKTNLSEWANIRSRFSVSGWSAVGGLVRNPYALDHGAGGSSSGSGAAIAASLAAAALGTETDGSVVCPAAFAGLAGFKPTLGLVSRTHVVPISHSQDTPGPMARSVLDAAILLTAMAGTDPADPATAEADARRTDYAAALVGASLAGKRLGVPAMALAVRPDQRAVFDAAVALLVREGAEVVEIAGYEPPPALGPDERTVLMCELKADLAAYLATTPAAVTVRTLADVIAFNAVTPRELAVFGQDLFATAEATGGLDDPEYAVARERSLRAAGADGIDRLLAAHRLDALIAPSYGPAGRIDLAGGGGGWGRASTLPAVAGYPHLTVPMGQVQGMPLGLSFIGSAWRDAEILALGHAFEQAAQARRPPTYRASIEPPAEFDRPAALTRRTRPRFNPAMELQTDANGNVTFAPLAQWGVSIIEGKLVGLSVDYFATPEDAAAQRPTRIQLHLDAQGAQQLGRALAARGDTLAAGTPADRLMRGGSAVGRAP